jgi:DNA-binding CsgD family transcriptional regulator
VNNLDTYFDKIGLTPRENEIAWKLAKGWPRKQIADNFQISCHTLDIHLANIRKKCGCETTFQSGVKFAAQWYLPAV